MAEPSPSSLVALMRWYLEAGVDETIGETPIDRSVPAATTAERPPAAAAPAAAAPAAAAVAVSDAVASARAAATLDDLRRALEAFDGCPLRQMASRTVFGRGSPSAPVVFIGEAPGAEEDRRGLPFVGPSGRLLDRILASIGLDESRVWISNTVFWQPPGNRPPSSAETAACQPFLQRMIEIIQPAVLVALGGPAATALRGRAEPIGRLRGHWFDYPIAGRARPAALTATFHPAYLLRSPAQKRLAWRDFLALRRRLDQLG